MTKYLAPFPTSGRVEGLEIDVITNIQLFNQYCLHNEVSIKTPTKGVQRPSELVKIFRCWEVTYPNSMGMEAPALRTTLPDLALCTSLSSCSSVSFIPL